MNTVIYARYSSDNQHGTQTISLEEIESALSSDLSCGSPLPHR